MITLDPLAQIPLYEQIYAQMRKAILNSVYAPGSKLPSVRILAGDLHCSRNTIEAAYRILAEEGFIESRPGSGFTVCNVVIEDFFPDAGKIAECANADPSTSQSECHDLPVASYDFTYGNLEKGTFPARTWKKLVAQVLDSDEDGHVDSYNSSSGEIELRSIIASQQAQFRGVRCTPDQVIIQSGTQASLHNLLLLFNAQVDTFAMEDPGYSGVRTIVEANNFSILPVPVFPIKENAYLDILEEHKPRLVYVTPSNQFPIGSIMSLDFRDKLCKWAYENDAYIIEDDYCFEYNCGESPLPAVQALDAFDRVIYMGTLSKSISPDLRVNYLILPPMLLSQWQEKFRFAYPAIPWLTQRVLAEYLKSNQRTHQLRRLRLHMRKKRSTLTVALRRQMGNKIDILSSGSGMHLLVNVKDGRSQAELIAKAREAGVRVYGTDEYWIADDHPLKSCVLVGFSSIPLEDIEPGIAALSAAWFE